MSQELVIWVVALWFVVFLLLGQAIATCLFGAGIVGILLWIGPAPLYGMVAQDIYFSTSSFTLSIIPLYLVMAEFLVRGGAISDLFLVGHRLAGRRRFPLGAATIVTGGMLGAVSGSGSASAASLAAIAVPELEKVGYGRNYSVAIVSVAGSLSPIIPPSLLMIIYGSMTKVPIGDLFIGAILPGLLCIAVFCLCLLIFPVTSKDAASSVEAVDPASPEPTGIPARTVVAFSFICFLMLVIFGGIYSGIMTVGEAGAIGAFATLVGLVLLGRLSAKDIFDSLYTTVKITAMIMFLIVGAMVFARFLSMAQVPGKLLGLVEPFLDQPEILIAGLMIVIFFAGMILESAAVVILLIPLIAPMIATAQIDPLWFGVMACFMISVGMLTPPVGLSVFSAAAVAKVSPSAVFRHAAPFAVVSAVLVTAAMLAFPELVTWLPSQIR